jgi:hypothetical protein
LANDALLALETAIWPSCIGKKATLSPGSSFNNKRIYLGSVICDLLVRVANMRYVLTVWQGII